MPRFSTDTMATDTMVAIHNRLKKLEDVGLIKLCNDRCHRDIKITVETINFNGINIPVLGVIS